MAWALSIPLIQLRAPGSHTTDTATESTVKYPVMTFGTTTWSQVPQKIHLMDENQHLYTMRALYWLQPINKRHLFSQWYWSHKKMVTAEMFKAFQRMFMHLLPLCQWIQFAYYLSWKLRFMFRINFINKFNKFKFLWNVMLITTTYIRHRQGIYFCPLW